jgi:hypothetical protein
MGSIFLLSKGSCWRWRGCFRELDAGWWGRWIECEDHLPSNLLPRSRSRSRPHPNFHRHPEPTSDLRSASIHRRVPRSLTFRWSALHFKNRILGLYPLPTWSPPFLPLFFPTPALVLTLTLTLPSKPNDLQHRHLEPTHDLRSAPTIRRVPASLAFR